MRSVSVSAQQMKAAHEDSLSMYRRSSNAPLTQGIIFALGCISNGSSSELNSRQSPDLEFSFTSNGKHHMSGAKGLMRCPAARFPVAAVANPKGGI